MIFNILATIGFGFNFLIISTPLSLFITYIIATIIATDYNNMYKRVIIHNTLKKHFPKVVYC